MGHGIGSQRTQCTTLSASRTCCARQGVGNAIYAVICSMKSKGVPLPDELYNPARATKQKLAMKPAKTKLNYTSHVGTRPPRAFARASSTISWLSITEFSSSSCSLKQLSSNTCLASPRALISQFGSQFSSQGDGKGLSMLQTSACYVFFCICKLRLLSLWR